VQHGKTRHAGGRSSRRQHARQVLVGSGGQEPAGAQVNAVDQVAVRAVTGGTLRAVQAGAHFDHEAIGLRLRSRRSVLRDEMGGERKNNGRPG